MCRIRTVVNGTGPSEGYMHSPDLSGNSGDKWQACEWNRWMDRRLKHNCVARLRSRLTAEPRLARDRIYMKWSRVLRRLGRLADICAFSPSSPVPPTLDTHVIGNCTKEGIASVSAGEKKKLRITHPIPAAGLPYSVQCKLSRPTRNKSL